MAPKRRGGSGGAGAISPAGLRLWAPWRYEYLRQARAGETRCIFCVTRSMTDAERRRRLILLDSPRALVMLNRYPYNNGHLMVAPRRHLDSPERLDSRERALLGELVAESVRALRGALHPDGFNLGANLGRVAGAGFAGHLHWLIVPRWNGDTNFMPAVASTRVLSQHLEDSYRTLRPIFKVIKADLS
jgi:ATP adenylyltransferase